MSGPPLLGTGAGPLSYSGGITGPGTRTCPGCGAQVRIRNAAHNTRTGKRVWHYPDGSYTTVIANQNALFLMGKYTLYKFAPKK